MTNGQIAQLQELSKCYMPRRWKAWTELQLFWSTELSDRLREWDKKTLRRLWHEYRHQIAAMRKNRAK
jgi:hypothetical protein